MSSIFTPNNYGNAARYWYGFNNGAKWPGAALALASAGFESGFFVNSPDGVSNLRQQTVVRYSGPPYLTTRFTSNPGVTSPNLVLRRGKPYAVFSTDPNGQVFGPPNAPPGPPP